ncbi:E3 ubiquitin-protein ligase rnf180-like [Plakobranchus ocellatus]|uniref:E3 ubiquitin-protein ligase rnf180-like n=1 Tax=Plakobranchus ocellatus TaxID=259542 RepID=A0AAV4C8G7_9GAST|nr:E3 ubiquitin-protein ligase rnf180-like [Plakobranchus ocellatus]
MSKNLLDSSVSHIKVEINTCILFVTLGISQMYTSLVPVDNTVGHRKSSSRRKVLNRHKQIFSKSITNSKESKEHELENAPLVAEDAVISKNIWAEAAEHDSDVKQNRRASMKKRHIPSNRLASLSNQNRSEPGSGNDASENSASVVSSSPSLSGKPQALGKDGDPSKDETTAGDGPSPKSLGILDLMDDHPTSQDPLNYTPTSLNPMDDTPTFLDPMDYTPTSLNPMDDTPTSLNPMDDTPTLLDPMDDYEHTCAICYEILVRPHAVRPCGHTFCESCLRQLQAATAARGKSAWVLCPICREGIQKCELKHAMDATVSSTYPDRYNERLRVLKQEIKKKKNSRLPHAPPASVGFPPHRQALRDHHRQPPFRPPPIFNYFGFTMIGVSIFCLVGTYLIYVVTTMGLIKFVLHFVGKSGLHLTPAQGDGPVKMIWIRTLSFVLFLGAVKALVTLSWGKIVFLFSCVIFLSAAGYSLDGAIHIATERLVILALERPW